jgi:putative endonuclease
VTPAGADRRQRAEKRGRTAELIAAAAYVLRGYQILGRRVKTPLGEIDLVARKGKLIVFIEVKWRKDKDDAILAVSRNARRRIEAAGRLFISRRSGFATFGVRYDIAAINGLHVFLIRDAWREGGA